ncbi:MAG: Tungsten-containing aldehyde:ferredoxin oxidoreductase [Clostridiales bacterium]|nr:Tungsten-containing aldehyde:ferredoxin oxidoreductase [Clostridiales bacterium]
MDSKYGGYMGRVLKIDLTSKEITDYPWTDRDRELYLGGKIMAAKILYDNLGPEVEPLSNENMIVISTGPFTGTGAPSSSRFNISSISPLTGFITSSNCGGGFGLFLKKAGYDALIIAGKSDKRIYIEIMDDNITFNDADSLWGKTTGETQEILGGNRGKLVIGPAGENLVKYAGIFSDERAAGRGGIGAVMGYKNLKGIVVNGTKKPGSKNPELSKEINKKWIMKIKANPLTGVQLPKYGTAGLITLMQSRKMLATRNFKAGQYKDFEMISGETLAEKYLIRNKGCITCPIQCGRQVEINGKKVKGPELETLGLLGPNIENNNLEAILKWNYELDELGMDTISTAGSISFAMELNEKGLWDNGLEFGKIDNLSEIFQDIAYGRGIGKFLAEGTKFLSEKFGGSEFAIHSKGMELSAYEPRAAVGQGLGYAVSNRGGCHLNAGYMVLFEGLGLAINPYTTKGKAELNVLTQNLMEAISASGNCLFTLYAMIPGMLVRKPNSRITRLANRLLTSKMIEMSLNLINKSREGGLPINIPLIPHIKSLKITTGMKMDFGRLRIIGERGYNLERMFNIKRGLVPEKDSLPKRLTHELQDPGDDRTRVPLDELKKKYYRARGWNENGVPEEKTLKRIGLLGIIK